MSDPFPIQRQPTPRPTDRLRRLVEKQLPRFRGRDTEYERHELESPGGPADVYSVRAKSSRHGKSTADKWNQ